MSIITTLAKNDILFFLEGLQYGSCRVSFENEDAKLHAEKAIGLLNFIHGADTCEMRQATNDVSEKGEWVSIPIDGVYTVIWREKEPAESLDDSDLIIEEIAGKAFNLKEAVTLKINTKLFKLARKIASNNNVKFTALQAGHEFNVIFDGRVKNKSTYKVLQEAALSGVDSISFDINEVVPQTLRVYVSQFNTFSSKKIRVACKDGVCTVYFKEPTIHEEFKIGLEAYISKYRSIVSDIELRNILNDLMPVIAEPEIPYMTHAVAEEWQEDEGIDTEPEDDDF